VSWEWKDDANWQSVATEHEELAELMTAWPLLSPDLRQAILAIVRSLAVAQRKLFQKPPRGSQAASASLLAGGYPPAPPFRVQSSEKQSCRGRG